jgi:uncharacterized protein GlcG (DUF336 family)
VERLVGQRHPSLGLALDLLTGVRLEAEGRGLALAACVVDAAGNVVASQRMDGTALGAMQLALGKAFTAVAWGTRTGDFAESTKPGGVDWGWNTTDHRIVVYPGGLPLLLGDGELVGAVGASGATAEEDEACVAAAARAAGFVVPGTE